MPSWIGLSSQGQRSEFGEQALMTAIGAGLLVSIAEDDAFDERGFRDRQNVDGFQITPKSIPTTRSRTQPSALLQ